MSKDIKEFPDLSNKLAAPTKKSLFERQKAEAEAKRAREEAETAAVYKDFVASFDDEDEDDALTRLGGGSRAGGPSQGTRGGFGGSGGGPKRHFGPSGPKSLNSGPGSLGPPPPSRKRPFEGGLQAHRDRDKDRERGTLGFEHRTSRHRPQDTTAAFQHSDDEDEKTREDRAEEKAAPKPTLQLTQLPPGTSPVVIKALIPLNLVVDNVKPVPYSGTGSSERRSMSAIVTLAKDTPASDIDTAVSALQNRYLGCGYYLNISRHLSSAALTGSMSALNASTTSTSLPFGASAQIPESTRSLNQAPPGMRGQFAPPTSYNPSAGQMGRNFNAIQVNIKPPADIKELKLIHKTVETLLTHGPEFEALLMSRPEVQQNESWAWIWNPRSVGGVWYRWRLWQVLTGSGIDNKRRANFTSRLFDVGAPWQPPNQDANLKFEWTTRFDEFVSEDEYDTSEDEDSDDEGRRRRMQQQSRNGGMPESNNVRDGPEKRYLNPLQKAKLTHLLARLPTTTARLRKGDVARVTAFAISHAGAGADEVVDMIVSNVERPFCWTGANSGQTENDEDAMEEGDAGFPSSDARDRDDSKSEEQDQTSAKLIALYLISDILSSSSTSGVRHAWRYRQLFENTLKARNIFANLGRLEKDLKWGRLRAEKWKRSVDNVLRLWEGWSAFQQQAQKDFVDAFNTPPLTAEELKAEQEKEQEKTKREHMASSKWKSVDEEGKSSQTTNPAHDQEMVDSEYPEMADGPDAGLEALLAAEESDGEPFSDEDIDGEPLDDSDIDEEAPQTSDVVMKDASSPVNNTAEQDPSADKPPPGRTRRQRPRAVDMFADSDGEQV